MSAGPERLLTEMGVDFLLYAIPEDYERVLAHLRAGRALMDRMESVTAGLGAGSVLRAQGKALDQILVTLEEEMGAACERLEPARRTDPHPVFRPLPQAPGTDPRPKRPRPPHRPPPPPADSDPGRDTRTGQIPTPDEEE